MMWMDPLSVRCDVCGSTDKHSVDRLKGLVAACHQCGKSFADIGRKMLEDGWRLSAQVQTVELILDMEHKLDVEYHDEEVEPIENLTIKNLIDLTETKTGDEPGIFDIVSELIGQRLAVTQLSINDNSRPYQLFLSNLSGCST